MATEKGLEEIPECMFACFLEILATQIYVSPPLSQDDEYVLSFFVMFAAQIESNYDEITDSFDNMNLKSELLRGALSQETARKARKG